ncbi:MAG: hypothetical protein L3J71_17280 [Victivallaceae bacterium]|nr:hypothetical protein [Victivallaceae bacterium]
MKLAEKKLKYVECSGSPREMGRQYGEQARDEIQHYFELRKQSGKKVESELFSANVEKLLQAFIPGVLEELKGIVQGADVTLEQVLFAESC